MAITRYGLQFPNGNTELDIEKYMIRQGGQWLGKQGQTIGNGMFWHFRKFESLLWPTEKLFHRWNELQLREYLQNRSVGVLGPASSGKTNSAATDMLADYYLYPDCTTILICSTTKERLQDRIWGEIIKYHKIAKKRWPDLPGNLIEGRLRIVTDSRDGDEGRDVRNGIIGVACVSGGNYRGLGDFIGIKNKRVRMAADELQLLPPMFVFSVSNLDKNPDFKVIGLGNPKDTTDALGTLCEPAVELGGWEGGIDQTEKTKVWKTRFGGVAVQLVGSDSPNLDGSMGIPLITQEAIDRDVERYGKDSLQFTMMNQGMMPKGQGSRRVITRQLCIKNRAMEVPEWLNSERIKIAFLDAAYRGVGGDRCMYGELEFGQEAAPIDEGYVPEFNVATKDSPKSKHRQIIALTRMSLVPVSVKLDVEPEDQIVSFVKVACDTAGIPPERFYFDAGMRTSLVTAFGRTWSPAVNSIDFGGNPSERNVSADIQIPCNKYYSKFVTELWFNVRLVIESKQFRGMTEGVMQEGCAREWTMVGANKIEVEPKAKMKEKTGKSPDLFDALACGIFGATRHGFVINALRSLEEKKRVSDGWKRDLVKKARASWKEGALTD